MTEVQYTTEEMMIVEASRSLTNEDICFVGIGIPSAACNLARLTHAPRITLIYESGTIGTAPDVLPLSIGDGELCQTAMTTVSCPEMFRYWLQGGWITVGFLGAAQLDRFGNINTTVIGDYNHPRVRLPGGGGAPEIATCSRKTYLIMKQSRRSFVEKLDFVTSFGFGSGHGHRQSLGVNTSGPQLLVTDMAIWQPAETTGELQVVSLHPGATVEMVQETVSWPVSCVENPSITRPPSESELLVLRDLRSRTAIAHGQQN